MANSSAPVHTRFQLFTASFRRPPSRESGMLEHPAGLPWRLSAFPRSGREGSGDRGATGVLIARSC